MHVLEAGYSILHVVKTLIIFIGYTEYAGITYISS